MTLLLILLLFFPNHLDVNSQEERMVNAVNRLRARGCQCGNKEMPPVGPVTWNNKLLKSAEAHAKFLNRKKRLTHYGRRGEDIGERINKIGYDWMAVGENLGEGQKTFREVFIDWIESPSHCKMLMNPKVEDMAVAKVGKYWVQHFGKEVE